MSENEVQYCARRAKEESALEMKAEKPEAAAAHHAMAMLYAARARSMPPSRT